MACSCGISSRRFMMPKSFELEITKELEAASAALMPALKRVKSAISKLNPEKTPPGALADLLYTLNGMGRQLAALAAPFSDVVEPKTKEIEEHFINTLAVGEA